MYPVPMSDTGAHRNRVIRISNGVRADQRFLLSAILNLSPQGR